MNKPSFEALQLIATADNSLFGSLITNLGFNIINDGSIDSISQTLSEEPLDFVELDDYTQAVKDLAEQQGYVLSICREILDTIKQMQYDDKLETKMATAREYMKN